MSENKTEETKQLTDHEKRILRSQKQHEWYLKNRDEILTRSKTKIQERGPGKAGRPKKERLPEEPKEPKPRGRPRKFKSETPLN